MRKKCKLQGQITCDYKLFSGSDGTTEFFTEFLQFLQKVAPKSITVEKHSDVVGRVCSLLLAADFRRLI